MKDPCQTHTEIHHHKIILVIQFNTQTVDTIILETVAQPSENRVNFVIK